MATHDYVVANGSGAAVRQDLNNALAAIVSNNSSATQPATTYAYMWWADTTAGQLKQRNSANSGWIVVRELDGTMLMESGTAAAPGLAFSSDVDTGLFRSGSNELAIATNGVKRAEFSATSAIFNNAQNDYDFRIEGTTKTSLFRADAANDRIGIGTGTPSTLLELVDDAPYITIRNSTEQDTDGGRESRIIFEGERSGGEISTLARIEASHEGTGDDDLGKLEIQTNDGSTLRTRLSFNDATCVFNDGGLDYDFRIEGNTRPNLFRADAANDRIGIGTGTPGTLLELQDDAPYVTIRNNTEEDTDGGRESRIIFEGERSGGEVSQLARIEASHTGTGDDDLGKLQIQTNDGSTLRTRLSFDDAAGVFNGGGLDYDFRIEGTNKTNLFRTDAANDRIGIGTSDPTTLLELADNAPYVTIRNTTQEDSNGGRESRIIFQGAQSGGEISTLARIEACHNGSADDEKGRLRININDGSTLREVLRITDDQSILIGQSTTTLLGVNGDTTLGAAFENATTGITLFCSRGDNPAGQFNRNSNGDVIGLNRSGTQVGTISVNTTNAAFNTSSDYRLKENVVDLGGAITRVKQLAPKRFNFIVEPTVIVDGFLAHEAQAVVPESVTGIQDEVDDDGNPVYQGIDQSKLVPLLTAALQEAISKIETLEAKVAALEAG